MFTTNFYETDVTCTYFCPIHIRNQPTVVSQQNEYKTQTLALFCMNLGHESQQFRSHIRESNQLWTQILQLLAKSQDLGLKCQMSPKVMHYCPSFCQAGISFVSVYIIINVKIRNSPSLSGLSKENPRTVISLAIRWS